LFSYIIIFDWLVNRSREEIAANMLSVASEPVKKTMIMYQARLSYDQLKLYLGLLQKNGLIDTTNDGLWTTTGRGKSFLEHYGTVAGIIA
jgi:predicted transcriptional regulator